MNYLIGQDGLKYPELTKEEHEEMLEALKCFEEMDKMQEKYQWSAEVIKRYSERVKALNPKQMIVDKSVKH